MAHIIGEFTYSIDAKGRVVIPPKFREFLGDTFIITKGLDMCLFVFPEKVWQQFEMKIAELPLTNKDARVFGRFFFASAAECSSDKQGRVMIPMPLRDFAGLDKTAVVVGMNNRIEIWSETAWKKNIEIDPDDLADHLADLGI